MFIDGATNPTTGAPAERNVPATLPEGWIRFRSAGARKDLLKVARSINIASLRDAELVRKISTEKQEARPLY